MTMRLLILGGTQFVGRRITEAALTRGHEVTLFNRGKTNANLFPSAKVLIGDRKSDVSALQGTSWDAVIDVNGYFPADVERILNAVTTQHYTFISTISVYAEHHAGDDETATLASMPEGADETQFTGETYGPLKVKCEKLVEARYPHNTLIVRPGLVVGAYDHTDRWTYWTVRTARGGTMLVPDSRERPIQVIDARDLADFTVKLTEQGATGIYNATGHSTPLGDILNAAADVTGITPRYVLADDAFLLENGVQPWQDFPIWMPADGNGVHHKNIQKALDAGLVLHSVHETIEDLWRWWQAERADTPLKGGSLSPERERELLDKWNASHS
jgi:2'-hydroxyisoflavone reductase